ncbi:hypothetical protein TKK_0018761 [Trichogramma kaykai]
MASSKSLYTLFFVALVAVAMLASSASACLPAGTPCVYDPRGTTYADCCSGFCLQQIGASAGVCADR